MTKRFDHLSFTFAFAYMLMMSAANRLRRISTRVNVYGTLTRLVQSDVSSKSECSSSKTSFGECEYPSQV